MKTGLCLYFVTVCCAFDTALSRLYLSEENDINFKRFQLLRNKDGDEEVVDLLPRETILKADLSDVTYYFYTKNNSDNPHIIQSSNVQELSTSPHFDSNKKFFFLIHGWVDNYTASVNTLVKAALLKKYDVNIVVVDWSPVASKDYITAMLALTDIGRFVADFINDLIDTYSLNGSQIAIIGHSFGAHIAGNAGSAVKSKVEQIIGLDPAAPSFTVDNTANRLDPNDAQYVQVIHTNGRFLGFSTSIGHVDYYPNGGMVQAGCGIDLLGGCSHARAFQYLAEAIENDVKFTATLCGSYSDYKNGKCSDNRKSLMGSIQVDKTVVGDFFLDTNSAAPYALG